MEPWGEKGEDLYITCSMPSIEVRVVIITVTTHEMFVRQKWLVV